MKKKKVIKIWNGRGYAGRREHLYVGAYSKADACRMLAEIYGCTTSQWYRELTIYFSEGCWGNDMEKITPERGLWVIDDTDLSKMPKRIYPILAK